MNSFKRAFGRTQIYDDLAEEMRLHLEEKIDALVETGVDRTEAEVQAKREFGNLDLLEERSREIWQFRRLESIWDDIKSGFRQLQQARSFAFASILVLTLGFGTIFAVFGVVDATLIKPLPYANASSLVAIYERTPATIRYPVSLPDYEDWKRGSVSFSSMGAYSLDSGYILAISGQTERVSGVRVTSDFFSTLGVSTVLGTNLQSNRDLHPVLLSYQSWKERYGGRTTAVGSVVVLDGIPNTIVGVLPESFYFSSVGSVEYWGLLEDSTPIESSSSCEVRRSCHNFGVIARLKSGESLSAAQRELTIVADRLEQTYPESNRQQSVTVLPLREALVGGITPTLLLLLVGASLLQIISCVNISSLLFVRAENRKREIAIRGAVGASPIRLIRQMVIESLVLVGIAITFGLAYAFTVFRLLPIIVPSAMVSQMPFLGRIGIDGHTISFAIMVGLLTTAAFSAGPISRLPFTEMRDSLAAAHRVTPGRYTRRLIRALVVLELAIATVLLVGASLLGMSLYRMLRVPLGLRLDQLVTVQLHTDPVSPDHEPLDYEKEVLNRVLSLPKVRDAAVTNQLPLGEGGTSWFRVFGRPWNGEHEEAVTRRVSKAYFATLQTPLLRGRYFTDGDENTITPVVVINRTMASRYFAHEDPIGRELAFISTPDKPMTIVGVIEDIREGALEVPIAPAFYLPFNPNPSKDFALVVRFNGSRDSFEQDLRYGLKTFGTDITAYDLRTMRDRLNDLPSIYIRRSSTWLVFVLALSALCLGTIGLYGVLSYSVTTRIHEIGVRVTLGAEPRRIYELILVETAGMVTFGVLIGEVGAAVAAGFWRGLLFATKPYDPLILTLSALSLILSALIATYFPARHAASVNPVDVLRAE